MNKLAVAAVLIAGASVAVAADAPERAPELPALYSELLHCRSLADRDARLSCFDQAAAKLDDATRKREIVVIDREQIKKTKRTLFGLAIPRIDILGGGKGKEEDEVDHIDGVIASARENGGEGWILRLEDGAVWQQTDSKPLALAPRPGQKVVVRRGTMGSYMLQVQGQPGIKVKRVS